MFIPIRRGFSLIELFIVITIMGILVAFAIPQFMVSIKDAKYVKASQDLDALVDAIRKYSLKNDGMFPRKIIDLRGYINKQPVSPWGMDYEMDSIFVFCEVLDQDDTRVKPMILRRAYRNPGLMMVTSSKGFVKQGSGLYLVKPMPGSEPPTRINFTGTPTDPSWREGGSKVLFYDTSGGVIRERFTFSGGLTGSSFNSLKLKGTHPTFNATGTFVVYESGNQLFISSGQAGTKFVIANSSRCKFPVWSPVANAIVCVDPRIRVIKNPDGQIETWRVSDTDGNNPSWSPDGRLLAYGSGSDIWIIPWTAVDGAAPQDPLGTIKTKVNLTVDYTGTVSKPSWSADGTMIAAIGSMGKVVIFDVERPDNNFEITYKIADGSDVLLENVDSIHWSQ
ncbi:MAG: prepilin-type N-terminal cleavage/methylation domain-containing protein [bacterium]|nr:prepilin-type N-terminal cleavage/methylation domain-containing protein [bacterium]